MRHLFNRRSAFLAVSVLLLVGWLATRKPTAQGEKDNSNEAVPLAKSVQRASVSTEARHPGTADYAWSQFASFLKMQNQAMSSGAAQKNDPDWAGNWEMKKGLHLDQGAGSNCPEIVRGVLTDAGATTNSFATLESSSREFPVQLKTHPPGTPGSPEDCSGIIQTVLYNQWASSYISGKDRTNTTPLNTVLNLDQMLAAKKVIDLPLRSVILKAIWEPIQTGTVLPGTIRVWDPGAPGFLNNTNAYPPIIVDARNGWPTRVRIDTSPQQQCDSKNYMIKDDMGASSNEVRIPVVPISCFAHTPVGATTYVLVGLNIAHKEKDGWYWITFAWTNNIPTPQLGKMASTSSQDPLRGLSRATQSQNLPDWSHYVMNMTDTHTDPTGTAICFDPYLEGLSANGPVSNCIRCHQFATYVDRTKSTATFPRDGQPVSLGKNADHGSSLHPIAGKDVQTYLDGTLRTDFLWSLVTNVEPE